MRILFLNPLSELGGAERCLLDLMASLRESHPDTEMHLSVGNKGPLVDEAQRIGVGLHIAPMPRAVMEFGDSVIEHSGLAGRLRLVVGAAVAAFGVLAYSRQLRRLIRGIQPDVIHSNGIKSHILAVLAGGGVPVVWHIRDLISRRPVVARALRLASRRASAAIAISQLVERDARSILRDLPIHVIYDAIDTDEFSPGEGNGPWLDALAGLPEAGPDTVRVGLIATYARWKGQDVFIDAIAGIPDATADRSVRYYIVGGPIYETRGSQFSVEELRERAAKAGVADRIGFVPFQRDVVEVYRALDVVVHASTQPEPFGRTIAEAMSCGRAVVLSCESGSAELLPDTFAGKVSPNDADALANIVCRLLTEEGWRDQLAVIGRSLALRVFSRPQLGGQVLSVLKGSFRQQSPFVDRPLPR